MVRLLVWALALSCLTQAQLVNTASTTHRRPCDTQNSVTSGGGVRALRDGIIRKLWGSCHDKTSVQEGTSKSGKRMATYANEVVLRFNISSVEEAEALAKTANTLFLDVWEFTVEWADIRVTEDALPSLLGLLPQSLQTAYVTLIPNLAKTIYDSYPKPNISLPEYPSFRFQQSSNSRSSTSSSPDFFFGDYQPLSVIHPWMRLISGLFPTHVRLINIGTTYEGRDILAFRIGVHPSNSEQLPGSRKTIIVSGGSHAREWISTAAVNYAAFSLISAYGKSRDITKLMEEFDWIFIPTLNPDGYVYTWESDRLWRKNRQETNLRFCKGIDLDRSFSYQWDGESTQGNPCSESYAGSSPLEAIESRRLVDWVESEAENNNASFVGFLDFHSYSQQVLYPFSYSCIQTPPTLENLEELGLGLAKAIRQAENKNYGVTSACEGSVTTQQRTRTEKGLWPRLESGGGSALDYMYHEMEIKYSYQIKLRDRGSYGFLLPSKNIVPSGKEVYGALTYFGTYLLGNKGIERMDDSPSSEGVVVLKKMEDTDIDMEGEPDNLEL